MADKLDSQTIIKTLHNYRQEAREARHKRMQQNRRNFECYHLRQDYSHKREGQSAEFLPKQSMAVEQISNFIQQGLIDLGNWFRIEPEEGLTADVMTIRPNEMQILIERQLEQINFHNKIGLFFIINIRIDSVIMFGQFGIKQISFHVTLLNQDFL